MRGYEQRTAVHDRAAQIADAFLAHASANLQPAEQSTLRTQISVGLARLHLNEDGKTINFADFDGALHRTCGAFEPIREGARAPLWT